jgi:hypothetical protein
VQHGQAGECLSGAIGRDSPNTEMRLMSRILLLVGTILMALAGPAGAQDRTGGGIYKQLLDNERVRAYQANFKPGDKLPERNYPSHLMYMLTDGTLVFAPAGRTAYEVSFKAGETMWFPPLARATENDSDQEVRVLVVEFKEAVAARTAKAKGKARAKGKAKPKAKAPAKAKSPAKK